MEVMGRLVCLENKVLKETQVYQVCQESKALLGQRYLAYMDNDLLFICIYHNISWFSLKHFTLLWLRVTVASLAKLDLQAKEDLLEEWDFLENKVTEGSKGNL